MRYTCLIGCLLVIFSCNKSDRVVSNPSPNIQTFRLVQVIDSIVSIPLVYRTTYFYSPSDICDSIVYESPVTLPPAPAQYTRVRMRLEYNSAGKLSSTYKKTNLQPEHLYSEILYDNSGKRIWERANEVTHKYIYDNSGRVERDTQFNSFGFWDDCRVYKYDASDNIIESKTYSRLSPDSAFIICRFDNKINPLHYDWNVHIFDPRYASPNNLTSLSYPLGTWSETVNYKYNAQGLPVKAEIWQVGRSEPTIRTFIYQ